MHQWVSLRRCLVIFPLDSKRSHFERPQVEASVTSWSLFAFMRVSGYRKRV